MQFRLADILISIQAFFGKKKEFSAKYTNEVPLVYNPAPLTYISYVFLYMLHQFKSQPTRYFI